MARYNRDEYQIHRFADSPVIVVCTDKAVRQSIKQSRDMDAAISKAKRMAYAAGGAVTCALFLILGSI